MAKEVVCQCGEEFTTRSSLTKLCPACRLAENPVAERDHTTAVVTRTDPTIVRPAENGKVSEHVARAAAAAVRLKGGSQYREKDCPVCARTFTPRGARQVYCSDECRDGKVPPPEGGADSSTSSEEAEPAPVEPPEPEPPEPDHPISDGILDTPEDTPEDEITVDAALEADSEGDTAEATLPIEDGNEPEEPPAPPMGVLLEPRRPDTSFRARYLTALIDLFESLEGLHEDLADRIEAQLDYLDRHPTLSG